MKLYSNANEIQTSPTVHSWGYC